MIDLLLILIKIIHSYTFVCDCVGLGSYEFALRLLREKHCAVAPGTAFDTGLIVNEVTAEHVTSIGDGEITSARQEQLLLLNGFIRVSLANTLENVCVGMSRICDFLDELRTSRSHLS